MTCPLQAGPISGSASSIRLSFVISTRNRADLIGRTLDTILTELPRDAELVVFDGASTDATAELLADYASRFTMLRYVRAATNSGIDADYDNAVSYARGDYVWLFGDDDLVLSGAITRVLVLLERAPDLIIVDAEVRDAALDRVLDPRRLTFTGERVYGIGDTNRLLADAGNALSFIGGTIVRRSLWAARERAHYYGTLFVHVGVIFQAPLTAIVVGEPLIAIRYGNASWSARAFDIWMRLWPDLVWSFPTAEWAKRAVTEREPWRNVRQIMRMRAKGAFDLSTYRAFFKTRKLGRDRAAILALAITPGRLVNLMIITRLRARGLLANSATYDLVAGPYATKLGRWIARA
jgi:abequosyltransferase